ncbi:MAG: hypothetical protein HQK76_15030 [Desulfobacterales bacterium]|nr:hypothetical protein [Desulfobacterales bacterium]
MRKKTLFFVLLIIMFKFTYGFAQEDAKIAKINPIENKADELSNVTNDVSSNTQEKAPIIFIGETVYEFPPVLDAEKVSHGFEIENKGNEVLKITKVRTG